MNEISSIDEKKFMITKEKLGKLQLFHETILFLGPNFILRSTVTVILHNVELCN